MSTVNWDEMKAIMQSVVEPVVKKAFEDARFFRINFNHYDEHPWTSNLRDMMKMLEGEIKLPHAVYDLSEVDSTFKFTHTITGECNECIKAFEMRKKYLKEQN